MKKVLIAVVALIATTLSSNAQIFIGGGLGVDFNGGKYKQGYISLDKPSEFAFVLSPRAGFYLNDDFAIGLEIDIINIDRKIPKEFRSDYGYGYDPYLGYNPYAKDLKENLFVWGISAFARYNLVKVNKFSLLLEGTLGIAEVQSKETEGLSTENSDPASSFGMSIFPVLSYSLTNKFSIEASCDFLRLGFTSTTIKDLDDNDNKDVTNNFGFGVNSSPLNNSIPVRFSVIYKF